MKGLSVSESTPCTSPAEADRLCGPTRPRVSVRRRTYQGRIDRMKIAAYQAPLLENGSMEALSYLRTQIDVCEDKGVEILCCPEAVLGGLADYSDRPAELAFNIENGQLEEFLSPLTSETVSTIIGFTESANTGLYNTAALLHESYLGHHCRMLFFVQLIFSTRYDWGLPTWIIRLRRAQPRRLSTCWLIQLRAFSLSPMRCL